MSADLHILSWEVKSKFDPFITSTYALHRTSCPAAFSGIFDSNVTSLFYFCGHHNPAIIHVRIMRKKYSLNSWRTLSRCAELSGFCYNGLFTIASLKRWCHDLTMIHNGSILGVRFVLRLPNIQPIVLNKNNLWSVTLESGSVLYAVDPCTDQALYLH